MTREEAARIYLDGLLYNEVEIENFFEAGRTLSEEDKLKIQTAVGKYRKDFNSTPISVYRKKASE